MLKVNNKNTRMTKTCIPLNKRNFNASQPFSEIKIEIFQNNKVAVVTWKLPLASFYRTNRFLFHLPILQPLKTPEKLWFSVVFRGHKQDYWPEMDQRNFNKNSYSIHLVNFCLINESSQWNHYVKSVQIRSYFWSEYRKIRTRNNSLFGHFSRSESWF